MTDSKLERRLRKLLALARQGVGGEKVTAQRFLDSLLKKHHLNLADIVDDQVEMHYFKYSGKLEAQLMVQVITTVCGTDISIYRHQGRRETRAAKCTKAQALEIQLQFENYSLALRSEVRALYLAFISTNDIFPSDGETVGRDDLTAEDLRQLKRAGEMMDGMKRTNHHKRLTKTEEIRHGNQ